MTPPTTSDIAQYLLNSGYPYDTDITDSMITNAMSMAQRDIAKLTPIVKFGTFSTVASQSRYDIFSTAIPAPTELVDSTGLRVIDAVWQPESDLFNPDDVFGFAPILQMQPNLMFTGLPDLSFTTPSDFTIFYADMRSWRNKFAGSFEPATHESGSPIDLLPTPLGTGQVLVTYTAPRDITVYENYPQQAYLFAIESYICNIMARLRIEEDSLQVGTFRSGSVGKFYQSEALRLKALTLSEVESFNGTFLAQAIRS